jgi:galactokinase
MSARAGVRVLISCELPEGAGVGTGAAIEAAIRLCLGDRDAAVILQEAPATPCVMLGSRPLPFDLARAGLRLVIIDTRVWGAPQAAPAEAAPVAAAAEALTTGDLTAIGPLLTAAHHALARDDAQHAAVLTALAAGALGARAITDGPGRPVLALVPASRLADVRAAVRAWFTRKGLRPPRFLTFTPAPASRRAWYGGAGADCSFPHPVSMEGPAS